MGQRSWHRMERLQKAPGRCSKATGAQAWGIALLGLGLAALAACSEPVDCGAEPGRCLPPAYGAATTAVRGPIQALRPQPVAEEANSLKDLAAPAAQPRPLPPGAKRLRAIPPTDTLAARSRDGAVAQVRDDAAAAVAAPVDRSRAIRAALKDVVPALKARDFEALKAKASQRFAQNIPDIQAKYAERFWRHADKYVPVLTGAPPTIELEDQGDGRVQAKITAPDTTELRCILVQEAGSWKIDRF